MLPKGTFLFKQDEPIDGIYLIGDGAVLYSARQEVLNTSFDNGGWLHPEVLQNASNTEIERKKLAEFSLNEIAGFEEFMRAKLLEGDSKTKKPEPLPSHRSMASGRSIASDSLTCRNYTCEVKSIFATVYFLKIEDFMNFYRFIPRERVKTGVELRLKLLHK